MECDDETAPPSKLELENIEAICRLCGKENTTVIELFPLEDDHEIAEKINSYLPIQVHKDDDLPQQCCCDCASIVLSWHNLLVIAKDTDEKFRSLPLIIQEDCTSTSSKTEPSELLEQPLADHDYKPPTLKIEPPPAEIIDSFYPCAECAELLPTAALAASHAHPPAADPLAPRARRKRVDQALLAAAEQVVVNGRVYYNCRTCGKSLHSPYTYVWHMRIHTGERPFVCDLCGKQFRVSQGLARHVRETHERVKRHACDLCGRAFTTRRNVAEHRRIHTDERPYVCEACGKAFKQKASLFVHKRSHGDYFPFKCSYCEQGFRTRPPLLVHVTRHTGEKPYKCEVCGRSFRIKYELKRHGLVHSEEKPWVCGVCGLKYRQKRYLRNHVKANHAVAAGGSG